MQKTEHVTYQHTVYACFVGYIVQAIVNNFLPLLFLTFHKTYGIPLSQITFLVTFNFGLQLVIDALSPRLVDRIGYRTAAVVAHGFAALGLFSLAFLPDLFASPYIGLMVSMLLYAVGGGLIEVIISPIVESCPTDNKEAAMSLLHSFYCWGHVGVVLISTIFFAVFGIEHWKILAVIWSLVPLANALFFTRVPVRTLLEEGENGLSFKELLSQKVFWLFLVLMTCAGASEQAVSQWASTFAEMGLGVSKTLGDLMGPMFFAICMGTSRALYGKFGAGIDLKKTIIGSSLLCCFSYLLISFSPCPALGLLGCGICGFAVGILWPGTFSMASASIPRGATMMFAYLALAGDLGCSLGPTVAGRVSAVLGDNLQMGILSAIGFPIVMLLGTLFLKKRRAEKKG